MSSGLEELESMEAPPLDETGKPKRKTRITTAAAVRELYASEIQQDQGSATTRVRIQAMVDGEPPFKQAALNASGQGSRANANFLMGQDLINRVVGGYLDTVTSPKVLMTLDVEHGEPSGRIELSRIICQELTRTIRKWPKWQPNIQRLLPMFVTHGVGVQYFQDTVDFRFEVTGFGDFLIPRQTPASEEDVPYAIGRKDTQINELFEKIDNEEVAKAAGWNVAAVKAAINRVTTKASLGEIGDIESFQSRIKNHDFFAARKYPHVAILHAWVKELDGSFSYYMTEKDAPDGEFLFQHAHKYADAEEAFNLFIYGTGNGTYHSIRGLGHMIYALCQLHNRVMCQKADGVMLSESIIVQATSGDALQRASLNSLGPLSLLDEGFEIQQHQFQGGSDRTMGFMSEIKSSAAQMSSRFMAAGGGSTPGVYQNKDRQNFEMESTASGETGAIDLFYSALDRLMRQMCKRILKNSSSSDKLVREFHLRCKKAGITKEIIDSVDIDSIFAYRALGAGSPAARSIGFRRLLEIYPNLDERGRRNLIYELSADAVGYQNVEEFATRSPDANYTTEAGLAELENFSLLQGSPVAVFPGQMHATHLEIHLPKINQVIDEIERGEADPLQLLPGLQATLDHIAAHGEAISIDPAQRGLAGAVKEAVNNLGQIVGNMERKIKAAEKKFRDEGGEQEGNPDAETLTNARLEEIKVATAEFKLSALQQIHNIKIAGEQSKIAQTLAMNDVKGARQLQDSFQYPGSDYRSRR